MGVSLSLTVSADRYCHLPNQKFSIVLNSAMNHPVRAQAWHWAIPFMLKPCLVGLLHRLLLPTVCLDFSTDFSSEFFFMKPYQIDKVEMVAYKKSLRSSKTTCTTIKEPKK